MAAFSRTASASEFSCLVWHNCETYVTCNGSGCRSAPARNNPPAQPRSWTDLQDQTAARQCPRVSLPCCHAPCSVHPDVFQLIAHFVACGTANAAKTHLFLKEKKRSYMYLRYAFLSSNTAPSGAVNFILPLVSNNCVSQNFISPS